MRVGYLTDKGMKRPKNEDAVKVLEGVAKGTDASYAQKANLELGAYYLKDNKIAQAKPYLQAAWGNGSSTTPEAVEAARLLYLVGIQQKNKTDAEKYIIWTDEKSGGNNADVVSSLIIFYFDNNEQSKGTARYNKAVQSANKDFVAEVNYNIGQYYLTKNNTAQAKSYLQKAYTGASDRPTAKILLLGIYEVQNNTAKVNSIYSQLKSASPKVTNRQIGTYFGSVGAGSLAEKYLQKAINEDKDNNAKVVLGQVYAGLGKKAEAIKILQEAVNNKVNGAAEVLKQGQAMK